MYEEDIRSNDAAKRASYQGLYDWMQSIVVTFLVFLFVLTFLGRMIGVQEGSMLPTLLEGDRMIVRTVLVTPQREDIIIFAKQNFQDGAALVKRVIALSGDVVDINTDTGLVYINGLALDEPFTNGPTYMIGDIHYPFTVPPGHVFVIGDNRNDSTDSRHSVIGPVDQREIIGQVVAVVFPLNRMGLFL